jgi:tRNA (pseudouridine54-N1)-methyltransferase
VTFHTILNGPPNPPLHIKIEGDKLYDVRTDVDTWQQILRKVIAGKPHPGISVDKTSFEALLKSEAQKHQVYILEEGGKNVVELELADDAVFVLGDHVGLPRNAERFGLRFGEKISLGKQPYLAASCITIINYLLDCRAKSGF